MLPSASKAAILVSLDNKEYSSRCDFSAARLFGRKGLQDREAVGVLGFSGAGGLTGDEDAGAGSAEAGGVARAAGFSCECGPAERWARSSRSSIIWPGTVLLTGHLPSQIPRCATLDWH